MKPELGEIVAALLLLSAVAAAGAEAATTAADTTLLPPALAADLAAHLGLPPSWQRQAVAWKPDQVALTRSLIGAGFHRELELELSVVVGEDAAGDGALHHHEQWWHADALGHLRTVCDLTSARPGAGSKSAPAAQSPAAAAASGRRLAEESTDGSSKPADSTRRRLGE